MYGDATLLNLLVIVFTIFISTALHEIMHAYVALKLGDDLAKSRGRISLNPMSHIDPFLTVGLPLIMLLFGMTPILAAKPVPINVNRVKGEEFGMAAIAIAGPLTNLLLAFVAVTLLKANVLDGFMYTFVVRLFAINVGLFVFNMLPIPPIDGSRIFYAFAPDSVRKVMETIESFGVMGVILIVSVLSPVLSPILENINQSVMRLLIG